MNENEYRIQCLVREAHLMQLKAKVVTYYQDFVQNYIDMLKEQFANKTISWKTIGQQIQI